MTSVSVLVPWSPDTVQISSQDIQDLICETAFSRLVHAYCHMNPPQFFIIFIVVILSFTDASLGVKVLKTILFHHITVRVESV